MGIYVQCDVTMLYVSLQDDGVKFIVNDSTYQFRGTLTVVSADNPASHLIGGYKSLTSSLRKCRFCMATNLSTFILMGTVNYVLHRLWCALFGVHYYTSCFIQCK